MIVNFMCQLNWIMGWPGVWLNIISGWFWKRLAFKLLDEVTQVDLPNVGGYHSVC